MATTKKAAGKLGETVTYISSKGYEKVALIVGTPESIQPGHSYPVPAEGQRHLIVFTLGGISNRLSVPVSGTLDEETDEPLTVGVWR